MLGESDLNTSYQYLYKDQLLTGTFGSCVSLVHVRGNDSGQLQGWAVVSSEFNLQDHTVH